MPTRSKSEITREKLGDRAVRKGGNEESEELLKASHQVDQTFSVGCSLSRRSCGGLAENPQTGKKNLLTKWTKGRDGGEAKEGERGRLEKEEKREEKLSEILSPSEKRRKSWLEVETEVGQIKSSANLSGGFNADVRTASRLTADKTASPPLPPLFEADAEGDPPVAIDCN